jgi:lysine-N-methylase
VNTFGLKYLDGFSCIGPDCEDDCCSEGWAVPVDEKHYHLLAERLAQLPDGTAEVARTMAIEAEPTKQRYALMVFDERQHCAQFDQDRLCRIHTRFGEEMLSDTCAVFPRSAGVVGDRFEGWASLSCPEIARRCLLVDGSTELVPMGEEAIKRGLIFRAARGDEDLYHASFDAVRQLTLHVLAQRQVPVATRLFALAWFADQTRAWLHKNAETVDREMMRRLFGVLRQPQALEQFHQQLQSVQSSEPFAASVVQQVILDAREYSGRVFRGLADAAVALDGEGDAARLWSAHRARVAALSPDATAIFERALEAFCRNFAFKDWYLKSESFNRWVHGLFVRQSIVRYLFAAHREVASAPERAVVEVAYSLSRTLEHDDRSMARIIDALSRQGMLTLAHAVALITF